MGLSTRASQLWTSGCWTAGGTYILQAQASIVLSLTLARGRYVLIVWRTSRRTTIMGPLDIDISRRFLLARGRLTPPMVLRYGSESQASQRRVIYKLITEIENGVDHTERCPLPSTGLDPEHRARPNPPQANRKKNNRFSKQECAFNHCDPSHRGRGEAPHPRLRAGIFHSPFPFSRSGGLGETAEETALPRTDVSKRIPKVHCFALFMKKKKKEEEQEFPGAMERFYLIGCLGSRVT
ncbi:hypothetical protein VUR80DRAFT_5939 [Thermomyces stellatus]